MTTDLWLIVAALVVCYGSIIATITGAAVIGLDYISTRLGLVEGAEFVFKVKQQIKIFIIVLIRENRSTLQMLSSQLSAADSAKFRFSNSTNGYS